MKVGVDRMHPDTSRRPLFRAASSRCVWALRRHTGEQYSAGAKASAVVAGVDCHSGLRGDNTLYPELVNALLEQM